MKWLVLEGDLQECGDFTRKVDYKGGWVWFLPEEIILKD
jgi:hypothetical protein